MNLYVHFPFCRRKCRYCALYSRCDVSLAGRNAYVHQLAEAVRRLGTAPFKTVYFGGGSPALCDLRPILAALEPSLTAETEFSVELHPQDVTSDLLSVLRDGGVNRISMGVQSLDDATLTNMGRGYSGVEAACAFSRVKRVFDNAGIDFIVGYPGDPCLGWERLRDWGLRHCSVYSLQNERGLAHVPDDDWTLDRIRAVAIELAEIGLRRYEISNYAVPGAECRHNLAVWRGEDYVGLGAGAYGRVGLRRTRHQGVCPQTGFFGLYPEEETVTAEQDALERRIFRLRTREGLDAIGYPQWGQALNGAVRNGLLTCEDGLYRLTERGTEVCDSILAELCS